MLEKKFVTNLHTRFGERQVKMIAELCMDHAKLAGTRVDRFMDMLVIN